MSDTTVYILSMHLLSGECTYSRNIVVWFLLSVYGFYCASKFENCLFLAFESENRDLKLILRQTEKELEDYKTKYKSQETIVQSQVGEFEDKVFFYTKQMKTIYMYMYHTSKWIDPMYISLCCPFDSTWFFFVTTAWCFRTGIWKNTENKWRDYWRQTKPAGDPLCWYQ